jgi:putative flippase GtrA
MYAPDVSSGVRPVRPIRWFRTVYDRFARLLHELGKFGVVGSVCYVVDVAVFNLCLLVWEIHWFPALVTSTVVAATLAFVGNRQWTWRDRERTALHREYGLYFGFNLVGLLISAAVLWLSHDVLGHFWPALQTPLADNISGKIIGVGLASMFRFWAYRRFVFKAQTAPI